MDTSSSKTCSLTSNSVGVGCAKDLLLKSKKWVGREVTWPWGNLANSPHLVTKVNTVGHLDCMCLWYDVMGMALHLAGDPPQVPLPPSDHEKHKTNPNWRLFYKIPGQRASKLLMSSKTRSLRNCYGLEKAKETRQIKQRGALDEILKWGPAIETWTNWSLVERSESMLVLSVWHGYHTDVRC